VLARVKEQLRNPLCDPHPYLLVSYQAMGTVNGVPVLESENGRRLQLTNAENGGWPETLPPLTLLGGRVKLFSAVLLRFVYQEQRIAAVPLTLVGEHEILRLAY
jgi:hypothetical protein